MGEGGRNYGEKGEIEAGSPDRGPVESRKKSFRIKAGKGACLEVPPDVARKLGLEPGAELEHPRRRQESSSGPTSTACPASTSSRRHAMQPGLRDLYPEHLGRAARGHGSQPSSTGS